MSAELLRRAAEVLRERAASATPGPWRWEQYREDLPYLVGRGGDPATYAYDTEVIEANHSGECGCRSACYLGLEVAHADRDYIATMHPGVGLALADWLDTAGADIWAHGPLCECGTGCDACDDNLWEPHARAALVVARLILGESS
jgi:hypothetical protein